MRLFSDQKRLMEIQFQSAGTKTGDTQFTEAINAAYRKIAGCHSWSYLHRRAQIVTNAPQSTGTIAYNAATNILTLTGATFPSWANQAILIVNSQIYAVANVITSTTASCVNGRSPAVDIDSGTSYILAQIEYPLPTNFLRMEDLITVGNAWHTNQMQPGSLLQTERVFFNPCRPWMYMVRGSTYYAGRMAIEFAPPPDSQYTYDIAYFAKPRPRTLSDRYTSGTISISGNTVTGLNTVFTQAMVGCRLRVGTTTAIPEGEYGKNGSILEYTVAAVSSATSLTLFETAESATNCMFAIDDPIDIDRDTMDEVFCRMCEYEFTMLQRDKKSSAKEKADLEEALRAGRARDVRTTQRPQDVYYPTFQEVAYANMGNR